MKKTKPRKQTKALAKVESLNKALAWGSVMSQDSQALQVREACKQIAKVFGVPPMGVNALGSQPYLNKDGRLYLLNDLRKGNRALKSIKTDFIQISNGPDVAAICKKTITFRDGTIVEAIGEAAPANVKLAAVKLTLNMMAETRALNRAIWQAIAGDVWNRVAANLQKMGLTEEIQQQVAKAGSVSYEEMEATPVKVTAKELSTEEKFQTALQMIKAIKNKGTIKGVYANIESSKIYSEDQKSKLMDALMAKGEELK